MAFSESAEKPTLELIDADRSPKEFFALSNMHGDGMPALTLTAPGAGLRHYITGLRIERHAAALLTAGTTPVVVTTTNLPGALAFSIPVEAAAQGSVYEKVLDPVRAIVAAAQNTATTIVAPLPS